MAVGAMCRETDYGSVARTSSTLYYSGFDCEQSEAQVIRQGGAGWQGVCLFACYRRERLQAEIPVGFRE